MICEAREGQLGVVTLLLPICGAAAGIFGFASDIFWLLVVGAALCGLNEFLNTVSGVYKFPFIALILVMIGGVVVDPWYVGAMLGLCGAGAADALGEVIGRFKESRG